MTGTHMAPKTHRTGRRRRRRLTRVRETDLSNERTISDPARANMMPIEGSHLNHMIGDAWYATTRKRANARSVSRYQSRPGCVAVFGVGAESVEGMPSYWRSPATYRCARAT